MDIRTVAVVGGGPAGATLAETLARGGAQVSVFEERPRWEKPCGGGLSYKVLRRYPFLLDALCERQSVRDAEFVAANGSSVRFCLRQPLAIYSRSVLNNLLLERAARAGAEVIEDRIVGINRLGNGWSLDGRKQGYRSDFLVLAAGARSRLRGALTENFAARDFMLTFGYYVPCCDNLLRVQFLDDFEGYAWAFPRPDHLSVGICGKIGEDSMGGLRERLRGFMQRFGYRTDSASVYSHLLPSLTIEKWSNLRLAGDGWALVGDAAGLVDPLTGEGIYYGMRSGELLGQFLLEDSAALYPERVRQEFSVLILAARLAPLFYHGDFLSASVTTRMIEFAARSRSFLELLQDLIEGSQSYSGLAARLYRSLGTSLAEIAGESLRQVMAKVSGVNCRLPAISRPWLKTGDDYE